MKRKTILLVFFIGFWILVSSLGYYFYQTVKSPNILIDQEAKVLCIPENATFEILQDSMRAGNFANDLQSFSLLAKIMKFDRQIKPGKYLLRPEMSNIDAIRHLRSGEQMPVNVTFNNIRLKEDLAEKITKTLALTQAEFLAAFNDSTIYTAYGFTKDNFMAMFIPNTYKLYWNTSAEDLIERMHYEYENFWSDEKIEKANAIGLSPIEVSILASIVYAESAKNDEIPKIAGLYMNRLNRNIALQADPTLIFAAQDFTIKRVLNVHKEIESPYNTYKYTGLPPGPINLPPIKALEGVLDYEKHQFIYMCAREDFSGYHNFATNLNDHLRNARRYQNALNKAKLYR